LKIPDRKTDAEFEPFNEVSKRDAIADLISHIARILAQKYVTILKRLESNVRE
jgi:hypothetical protein